MRCLSTILVTWLAYGSPVVALGQPPASRVEGEVTGPTGAALPGATVSLLDATGSVVAGPLMIDISGLFVFERIDPGIYVLLASFPGFVNFESEPLVVVDEDTVVHTTVALVASFSDSVTIQENIEDVVNEPEDPAEFRIEALDLLPLANDRFQEALPLIPGVVRDPDGRLSFNGARPSESVLLVNGANVTDPLTGEFALDMPLKAIEAVQVYSIPYSAEYGRTTAAVAEVTTRGGQNEWEFDVSNILPKLRFRGGTIRGINSWIPQFQVSGPLKESKAWLSQGVTYRFARSRVFDAVEPDDDERVLESFDSFTQIDLRLNEKHSVTGTFSYFALENDNFGLDALTAPSATPEFASTGFNAAFALKSQFRTTIAETLLSVKNFDVTVTPQNQDRVILTPEGLRSSYFNTLDRDSRRWELSSKLTRALDTEIGKHIMKLGGNVTYTSFSGEDTSAPIDVLSSQGRLLRRFEFEGDGLILGDDVQLSAFVQDQWRPNSRFGIDLGIRYDYDRIADEHQLSPRLNFAYSPNGEGSTVIRAGWGVFYDQVFLHASNFDRFQDRVETSFAGDGSIASQTQYRHRISPDGISLPRNITWNIELNRALSSGLKLRVNYRSRRGTDEMRVDKLAEGLLGTLLLSSNGGSEYDEFDVTLRADLGSHGHLFTSYTSSRAVGELNNLGELYTNTRQPFILEARDSLLPHDVPHRFLTWGVCELPFGISVAPGVEWRSGFPYTVFSEEYVPIGERNRGGRFPTFFSMDLDVTKKLVIKGRKFRVGVRFFNLGSHVNPRDVVTNMGSPRFGEFLNSVDMRVSFRFGFGF